MFRAAIRKEGVSVTEVERNEPQTIDGGGQVVIAYDETPELAVNRLKATWEWRLDWAKERVAEAEAELALIANYLDSKGEEK